MAAEVAEVLARVRREDVYLLPGLGVSVSAPELTEIGVELTELGVGCFRPKADGVRR